MRVEESTGLGWPKQVWSDTMNADIRWLDLNKNDLSDRVRWKVWLNWKSGKNPPPDQDMAVNGERTGLTK